MRGGRIQCSEIGAFTFFNKDVYIRYVSTIGRFVQVGPNVKIGLPEHSVDSLTANILFIDADSDWSLPFSDYREGNEKNIAFVRHKQYMQMKKPLIEIGNDVWIGADVIVMRGVKIGDGAVIAAGAVVTKDVAPYTVVGGIPARTIKQRFPDEIISRLLEVRWWKFGPDVMKNVDITDIEKSVKVLEERISTGIPKYDKGKIVADGVKKQIYKVENEKKTLVEL